MEGESERHQPVSNTSGIPYLFYEDFIPVGPDDPFMSTLREVFPSRATWTASRPLSDDSVVAAESAEDDSVKQLTIDELSKIKDNVLSWMKDIDYKLPKSDIDPTLLDSVVMDVVKNARTALQLVEEGRFFISTEEKTADEMIEAFLVDRKESKMKSSFGQ